MITDKEYQIKNLEKIFNDACFSPAFHQHEKYPIEGLPRISYDDVMNYKYIIRNDRDRSGNTCWSKNSDMIVEYQSIEDLVDDGWRLD